MSIERRFTASRMYSPASSLHVKLLLTYTHAIPRWERGLWQPLCIHKSVCPNLTHAVSKQQSYLTHLSQTISTKQLRNMATRRDLMQFLELKSSDVDTFDCRHLVYVNDYFTALGFVSLRAMRLYGRRQLSDNMILLDRVQVEMDGIINGLPVLNPMKMLNSTEMMAHGLAVFVSVRNLVCLCKDPETRAALRGFVHGWYDKVLPALALRRADDDDDDQEEMQVEEEEEEEVVQEEVEEEVVVQEEVEVQEVVEVQHEEVVVQHEEMEAAAADVQGVHDEVDAAANANLDDAAAADHTATPKKKRLAVYRLTDTENGQQYFGVTFTNTTTQSVYQGERPMKRAFADRQCIYKRIVQEAKATKQVRVCVEEALRECARDHRVIHATVKNFRVLRVFDTVDIDNLLRLLDAI